LSSETPVWEKAGMGEQRPLLDDRAIEFDGLAIVLMACAFLGVGVLTVWVVGSAAQRFDAPVLVAGAAVSAAVMAAWIFGYPRRAAIPAMALAILAAMIALPAVFEMDGALLREAVGAPASRLYVVMGLYVGGLGVFFLAFMVFGFFAPLAGAILGLKRGEKQARETLALHCVLLAAALALILFPRVGLQPL
jgi:hypothetical protein